MITDTATARPAADWHETPAEFIRECITTATSRVIAVQRDDGRADIALVIDGGYAGQALIDEMVTWWRDRVAALIPAAREPGAVTFYSAVLAANARSARARTGLSQKSLAKRMQALGFRTWAWQTVGKVENDVRPLLAAEVLGLALALETTISDLMATQAADHVVQLPGGVGVSPESVRMLAFGTTDRPIMWEGEEISTTTERTTAP